MRTGKTCIKPPYALQCCLLFIVALYSPRVNGYPPDDMHTAIVSMLPEGDITADVLPGEIMHPPAQYTSRPGSGRVDFSIASDGRFFRFWADGKLTLLESVRIDLEQNRVWIGNHVLPYAGKQIADKQNPQQSRWRIYTWFSESDGRFTLAQHKQTGQTFLHISMWGNGFSALTVPAELSLLF